MYPKNSGFSPQIIHFIRLFHYKPSILGHHYFWKHLNKLQGYGFLCKGKRLTPPEIRFTVSGLVPWLLGTWIFCWFLGVPSVWRREFPKMCKEQSCNLGGGRFLFMGPFFFTKKCGQFITSWLRPAATRNAQRCVPNADPQRKGPKWVSSSADGVDAFSPGRKKHPKEPYVLKGHVTSSHGPYWSTDCMGWMQVREGDSAKLATRYVQLRVRMLLF